MGNPITGMSPEDHSRSVKQGMEAARSIRQEWVSKIATGEVEFKDAVEYSRGSGETRHLAQIKLIDILKARPGWTEQTVMEVLQRNGFERKTTIQSIRRSVRKVELFTLMLKSTADRWRARPEMPPGWPWMGKLDILLDQTQTPDPRSVPSVKDAPEEEEDEEDTIFDTESHPGDDALAALLDGPD